MLSEFDKAIEPFTFEKEHSRRYSVALTDFEKLEAVFCDNAEGNGYDWEALIKQFVKERFPEERRRIRYDSEAGMFYMYCSDEELMKKVITAVAKELKKNEMREYVDKIDFSII